VESIKYIGTDEVGQILGYSRYWVQTRHEKLNIPSYRIGGEIRFIEEEIHLWVKEQKCGSSQPDSSKASINLQKVTLV
jgi:predicted DNA-binding transcriptional regulator AlpA